jgi:hypothetical protein
VLGSHPAEPPPDLFHKADMRGLVPAGVRGNHIGPFGSAHLRHLRSSCDGPQPGFAYPKLVHRKIPEADPQRGRTLLDLEVAF